MAEEIAALGFRDALQQVLSLLQVDELITAADLARGLDELELDLLAIATDAQRAEVRGTALAVALRDHENYPRLACFHASVEDMLTLALPRELVKWAKRFMGNPPPPALESLFRDLVLRAASDPAPLRRRLCEVLLIELVRVELLLRMRWFPDETYRVGMEDPDLDHLAEREMRRWLEPDAIAAAQESSLQLMVAGALEEFTHQAELMAFALRTVGKELHEMLERRAKWEARLAELDARDAILVRNELADAFGDQRLSVELIRERHDLAFGGVETGTLHTRLTRVRDRMRRKGPAIRRRRRVSLLDLAGDLYRRHGLLPPRRVNP